MSHPGAAAALCRGVDPSLSCIMSSFSLSLDSSPSSRALSASDLLHSVVAAAAAALCMSSSSFWCNCHPSSRQLVRPKSSPRMNSECSRVDLWRSCILSSSTLSACLMSLSIFPATLTFPLVTTAWWRTLCSSKPFICKASSLSLYRRGFNKLSMTWLFSFHAAASCKGVDKFSLRILSNCTRELYGSRLSKSSIAAASSLWRAA